MLKQRRENRIVNCLVCWTCHGRMGPNHFTLKDGGAVCGLCQAKNPLGNLHKLSMLDLTEPREIWIPWTQSGTAAHALSSDGRTVLGPWITFASAATFERALIYIGMTEGQLAAHLQGMRAAGNGCAKVRFIPGNRKNLFKIDWKKLG